MLEQLLQVQTLIALLTAVAVFATVMSLAIPYFSKDQLGSRMKSVALEREKIRARERARLNAKGERISLRSEPKAFMNDILEKLNMKDAFSNQETKNQLKQAGFRNESALVAFTFARTFGPLAFLIIVGLYVFVIIDLDKPLYFKMMIVVGGAYAGYYAPNMYLRNITEKRQKSITRAWPDALDLLLICVESGMSIEASFRKVSEEIGTASVELAEEMTLTTAEMSYLQDRRSAFENLAMRTGLDGVRAVTTALIQAEKYGTPVGSALRTMSEENRTLRMQAAEKKAAALPPLLTVPMILFFLPVIFAIILGPAGIQVSAQMG
ncbi:MAG: type II secretion system F family protein [Cohaesibacteraceae bacterium]|nr:type II secretion system F family protein [Cohaesibacteraceae bacterium]